ncbi:MAG: hypothetical protein AAF335_03330 [Bacteroidota bacterium]
MISSFTVVTAIYALSIIKKLMLSPASIRNHNTETVQGFLSGMRDIGKKRNIIGLLILCTMGTHSTYGSHSVNKKRKFSHIKEESDNENYNKKRKISSINSNETESENNMREETFLTYTEWDKNGNNKPIFDNILETVLSKQERTFERKKKEHEEVIKRGLSNIFNAGLLKNVNKKKLTKTCLETAFSEYEQKKSSLMKEYRRDGNEYLGLRKTAQNTFTKKNLLYLKSCCRVVLIIRNKVRK